MSASTRATAISRTCAQRSMPTASTSPSARSTCSTRALACEFQQILPGRNVVACRVTHPLLLKRRPSGRQTLLDYPWVAPPPGSPLLADLRSLLLSFGATEIKIRYSGGSLMSVVNYHEGRAMRSRSCRTAWSSPSQGEARSPRFADQHPASRSRALGLLRRADALRALAVEAFAAHIRRSFDNLKHLIKRHEQAVVWAPRCRFQGRCP